MQKDRRINRRTNRRILCCLAVVLSIGGSMGCRKQESEKLELKELNVKEADTKDKADPAPEDLPSGEQSQKKPEVSAKASETDVEKEQHIFVFVCGAVTAPGVYELAAGSRIYEAVAAAGGLSAQADPAYLNQAEVLKDEQRVYVPVVGEMVQQESAGTEEKTEDGRINLNTASKEELMTLPGIGEAKADSIMAYREQQGSFAAIEDIKQIEGIKDGVYSKIKDKIAV